MLDYTEQDNSHTNVTPHHPKSLRAIGAPRPSTAKRRKPHRRPNQAIAMRQRWTDPSDRAKQIAGRQRTALDRARHPDKYSRAGIPNGMRKAEAQALWDKASTLADAAIKQLEGQGVVERAIIPDTDDAIAKECLREAIKMTLGPGNVNNRLAAARLVLTYTKPRPANVVETQELLAGHRDVERLMAVLLGPSRIGVPKPARPSP